MILIRTQTVDDQLAAFARDLANWSGMVTAFIVDERKGEVTVPEGAIKLSLTEYSCRMLGVYCPHDFAWRCGDYGLYLARRTFSDVRWFWLIESDVRIAGAHPEDFFSTFEKCESHFLSSYVAAASSDWPWYRAAVSRDFAVHKCFFPVCRFSAEAIDRMLDVRRLHGKTWSRRHFWPNDESFVATTLIGEEWTFHDLNKVGSQVYDTREFHFETVFDGDRDLPKNGPVRLFHPVLFSSALETKRTRLAQREERPGWMRRIAIKFDLMLGLSALAFRINRSRKWYS